MSDHETARSTEGGVTLDEVAGAMAAMRAENAALAARLEEFERRSGPPAVTWDASAGLLETETPAVEGEAGEGEEDPAGASRGESGISRRSAFKALGAAAAAGAGVALGATVFGADPAAAEPMEYVRLGHSNVAVAETSITTDMGHGMLGSTSDATSAGIGGQDTSTGGGTGVQAQSTNGLGLVAQGGLSPLLLTPSTSAGPPTSGAHSRGEVYVDAAGFAFVCSLAGSPGTWQRITPAAPDYNNSDAGSLGMSGSLNLLRDPRAAIRLAQRVRADRAEFGHRRPSGRNDVRLGHDSLRRGRGAWQRHGGQPLRNRLPHAVRLDANSGTVRLEPQLPKGRHRRGNF